MEVYRCGRGVKVRGQEVCGTKKKKSEKEGVRKTRIGGREGREQVEGKRD